MADIRDEDDARSRVQARLVTGERILWVGRPDPAVLFASRHEKPDRIANA